MSRFFDSEQVRKSLFELEELQKKIFDNLFQIPFYTSEQKKELQALMQADSPDKVDKVLSIFKQCKVDEWAESLKVKYMNEAFEHLENIAVMDIRKKPLIELANYLMNRTK